MKGGKSHSVCDAAATLDDSLTFPDVIRQAMAKRLKLSSLKAKAKQAMMADEGFRFVQCVTKIKGLDNAATKSIRNAWASKTWKNSQILSMNTAAELCLSKGGKWSQDLDGDISTGQAKKGMCGVMTLQLIQKPNSQEALAKEDYDESPYYWLKFKRIDNLNLPVNSPYGFQMMVRIIGQKTYRSLTGKQTVPLLEVFFVE